MKTSTTLTILILTLTAVAGCGDDQECDPNNLKETCKSLGFHHGTPKCTSEGMLDTSGCGKCDDGVKNGEESDVDCGALNIDDSCYTATRLCKGCKKGQSCNTYGGCDMSCETLKCSYEGKQLLCK